jgi:UDP-N-acetylmuramoylalanine--D-glutamate ligase
MKGSEMKKKFDAGWFRGRKVTVMGLGLFGGQAAVTRFLCRLGAKVTVTDLRGPEALRKGVEAIGGFDVRLVLGRHDEADFTGAEAVVTSPAVPGDSPYLEAARRAGARIESEMNLFFQACRSRWIVGVTGSNGKSTTTALTGEMLAASGVPARVGGNIGKPLIEEVEGIGEEERVVLELSSFQLEDLARLRRSPRVAVVTNVTPNHLDRHKTFEAYLQAKTAIFRFQRRKDAIVLNADDPVTKGLAERAPGRVRWFSLSDGLRDGFLLAGGRLVRRRRGRDEALAEASSLRIPGLFNAANALAAAAAALEAGATPEGVRKAVASFAGIPHRLERVADRRGAAWYNDSIATTPESVLAALSAFQGGVVVIAGGYDKKIDLGAMCSALARRARAVILMGATGPVIAGAIAAAGGGPAVAFAASLEEAVGKASALCLPGDAVLLSPGCASYDMFLNFEERGDRFRELVLRMPE